jgi:hypothetical protein
MAATYTWNATSGSASWTTVSDWTVSAGTSSKGYPSGAAQTVYVNEPGTYTITLTSAIALSGASSSLNINDANATLAVDSQLTVKTLALTAGTISLSGAAVYESDNATVSGLIVGSGTLAASAIGGTWTFSGGGEIESSGGLLDFGYPTVGGDLTVNSGQFVIGAGSELELDSQTDLGSNNSITFAGAGTLGINVDGSTLFSGGGVLDASVSGVTVGTTNGSSAGASVFDLINAGAVTSGAIIGATDSTLEVVAGGTTYLVDTTTSISSADTLNWASDGNGGTDFWADTNPCYAAGTRVLTERGEVVVEDLAEGDMVVTLSGDTTSLQPVRWIGNRRMNLRQHPQPNLVAPVRVRQHAFGDNMPSRDLLLSPDHCLFVDGKLIPAKLLINDLTIVQERETAVVHYYHVELDRHAVILTEGLPAESYLDTGNRAMFANAGLALMLHPDFEVNTNLKCWATDACAPLAVSAEIVKPIHARLAERAESLGYQRRDVATSTDPELRLVADGRVIRPLSSDANRYVFTVPAGVSSVRLTSRASVPSYFEAYLDDWRQLGVAVRRIVVRDSAGLVEIPPDHPGLTQGWHKVEHDDATMWRWMNGDAVLPIGPTEGPALVEVQVGMVMQHVVEDAAQDRLAA